MARLGSTLDLGSKRGITLSSGGGTARSPGAQRSLVPIRPPAGLQCYPCIYNHCLLGTEAFFFTQWDPKQFHNRDSEALQLSHLIVV